MEQPTSMTTLSQMLNKLTQKGFDNEIRMNENRQMMSIKLSKTYQPEDLLIFHNYRFEGNSDPDDNAVLYLLEDKEGNIGYILDSYGVYSNYDGPEFDDFIKKIPVDERDDQELFS